MKHVSVKKTSKCLTVPAQARFLKTPSSFFVCFEEFFCESHNDRYS